MNLWMWIFSHHYPYSHIAISLFHMCWNISFSDNKWKNHWIQHCVQQVPTVSAPCCSNHGCVYTTNNKSNHISNDAYCLSISVDCQCILWRTFASLTREVETQRLWERIKRWRKHVSRAPVKVVFYCISYWIWGFHKTLILLRSCSGVAFYRHVSHRRAEAQCA